MDWPHPDESSIYNPPSIPGPRAQVGEVSPGLRQRARGAISAFIVIAPDAEPGDASVTMIDAGWPYFHKHPVLNYLRSIGYQPESVRLLISTNYHQDHVGGMADLRRATGAPVSAHRLNAPHLAGEPGWTIPNPVEPKWLCPLLSATALDDEDALSLLGGATVIHTRGHTPGSISLHFPDEGVLIVANALQRYGNRLTLPSR